MENKTAQRIVRDGKKKKERGTDQYQYSTRVFLYCFDCLI